MADDGQEELTNKIIADLDREQPAAPAAEKLAEIRLRHEQAKVYYADPDNEPRHMTHELCYHDDCLTLLSVIAAMQSAAPAACEWQIEHSYLEAFEKFYRLDCRFGMTNTEAIAAFRKRLLAAAPSPAPVDLEGVLVDVCQLIDGWHTDVVWSEWDESVRWRVHCELAKMNGQEPLPRDSFRHPSAAPVPPSPLAEENARTESPSAQEYEPSAGPKRIWLTFGGRIYNKIIGWSVKGATYRAQIEYVRADILAAERKKVIEECAKVAADTPDKILCMWSRPGGPPGNGWAEIKGQSIIAQRIRSLAATEG